MEGDTLFGYDHDLASGSHFPNEQLGLDEATSCSPAFRVLKQACFGGHLEDMISIDEQSIFLWSLDSSKKSAQVQSQESAGMLHHLSGGAWDPHDVNVVASTTGSSIQFWDLRTMKYGPIMVLSFLPRLIMQ